MSKFTKFLYSPRMFFQDAKKKAAVRKVDQMSLEEQRRFGLIASEYKDEQQSKKQKKDSKEVASRKSNQAKSLSKNRSEDLQLANKLLDFEVNFPVNSLQGGAAAPGLLMWPLFRHILWVRCQASYKGKNASEINTCKLYISREWQEHYSRKLPIKTLETLPEENCDFLFFTNLRGTEQTRINGYIYNRITDPVFEVARTLGRAKKVEVVKSIGDITSHRVHDVDVVLPPMLRKVGYAPLTDRPKDFLVHVQKYLPEAKFDERSYNECVEWFFHQRDFYLQLLKCYNPKVIFFVGFDYHYALVCAAKKLGIKTVDLQHGVQAGWSPVYNRWQAIPRQGYELLPDVFWVWGDYDANKIRENFGDDPEVCGIEPLIGGFPWLERQKDLMDEVLPASLSRLQKHIINKKNSTTSFVEEMHEGASGVREVGEPSSTEKNKKVGVLTLQDQISLPFLFEKIILDTSDRIEWIIKRHPKHQSIDLSSLKGKATYSREIDNISFMALARVADIHMTECSTTVIEADYFGVPSVVCGYQGFLNYSDFIELGMVFHIDSPEAFENILESALATVGESQMKIVDNTQLEKALRILIDIKANGEIL
ncbi:hypothetical protein ACT3RU_14785 [Halomonas sp. TP35]